MASPPTDLTSRSTETGVGTRPHALADHRARRHDHPPSNMYSIAVNPMLSPTTMMLGIATKFQIAMQGTDPISHIDSYGFRNQVAYLNNLMLTGTTNVRINCMLSSPPTAG